ncbi:MAG: 4Fe-4S binding protein, partial [Candidatus Omnitrophica bacterium]|nr:4Fe-4S binding protein [Candidatus Omnitrophota bacterium]
MKKAQSLTIWLLPLILFGGLLNPALGYLVVAMMAFFLTLSFFKGRYWCWNLCPRGAFLDIALSKFSLNRFIPRIFLKQWFRWSVFTLFAAFLVFRLVNSGGEWLVIGSIFVSMCILTTAISVILGVFTRHRGWCTI